MLWGLVCNHAPQYWCNSSIIRRSINQAIFQQTCKIDMMKVNLFFLSCLFRLQRTITIAGTLSRWIMTLGTAKYMGNIPILICKSLMIHQMN